MTDDGVRTQHPDYVRRSRQWQVMRDVIEGSDAIKDEGEKYLPRPSSSGKQCYDNYEEKMYQAFKERTAFVNYTAQIKDCLHGMIENRPAKIEIPKEMRKAKILENIDFQGRSADQFFSDVLEDILVTARGGVLIELPNVDPNMSVAQAEKQNVRAYPTYYNAESIINWNYRIIKGIKTLSLVVLKEEVNDSQNIFSHHTKTQYRVLYLNSQNIYCQSIYQIDKDSVTEKESEKVIFDKPILIKGKTIDYIPFVMMPFNDPVKPTLYDIALVNIHHYQVSADYQNGAHMTSRPTLYFTGHNPEIDKEGNPVPVQVGTDIVWQLPEKDAKVGICSFSGEGIEHLEHELSRGEAQIITLASHIISQEKKTAENKDAISIHRAGEDAKLATIAKYMSERFSMVLKTMARFDGYKDDNIFVELNTDFSNLSFDANAVNSIANIFSQGKLPLRCLYYLLQSSGYLEPDMSYEGFVYLLDLEASSLNPQEVDEAYKMFKKNGEKKELNTGDWYSSQDLYKEKEEPVQQTELKDKDEK